MNKYKCIEFHPNERYSKKVEKRLLWYTSRGWKIISFGIYQALLEKEA